VSLPYIKDFTDKAVPLFKKHNINVALIPGSKLKSSLKSSDINLNATNTNNDLKRSNIVYCIPCSDCDKCYIGLSRRPFEVRLKEHVRSVKNRDLDYATAAHVVSEGHTLSFDRARVIDSSNINYNHLAYLEATHIISNPVFNGNTAWRNTNHMWLPFLPSVAR